MTNTARQRKTKDPCPTCYMHRTLCICHLIPQFDLRTRVCLVVHSKELKRSTNTGRLVVSSLVNSEMRVRGKMHEPLDLSDLLTANYRSVLFYPADDAVELTREWVAQDEKPIQLIVPDGNWRQAAKVHYRHQELKSIQRVKISTPNPSKFHMRAEHTPEGMATLQAIAYAMEIIEGDAVKEKLLALYQAKLERTLLGRGFNRSQIVL